MGFALPAELQARIHLRTLLLYTFPAKKQEEFLLPATSLANRNADISFMYFTYAYFVIYYFLLRVCAAFDDFNTTP